MNIQVNELSYAIKYYSMLLLAYAVTPIGSVLAILALPCFLIMLIEDLIKKTSVNPVLKKPLSLILTVLRYGTAPGFFIGYMGLMGVLTLWNNLDHRPKPYSTKQVTVSR